MKIFEEVKSLEKYACEKFGLTEDLMIENAAMSLERVVRKALAASASAGALAGGRGSARAEASASAARAANVPQICILCGSGNNGADGYALARRLAGEFEVAIVAISEPKSPECVKLAEAARAAGAQISTQLNIRQLADCTVIIDCIYGTGFHGQLSYELAKFLHEINSLGTYKIACDIPSGIDKNGVIATVCDGEQLAFCADVTVTMGGYKIALFSDVAKNFTGKIVCGKIGVSEARLTEKFETPFALLEANDMKLPFRKNKASHKGNYGHVAVFMGEKFGAATIAATAALNFGAGLVSLVDVCADRKSSASAAPAFSPELMYAESLPETTTAISVGSGLGRGAILEYSAELVRKWLSAAANARLSASGEASASGRISASGRVSANARGIVFDADIFYYEKFAELINDALAKNAQVVLTPHPKEFQSLLRICMNCDLSVAEIVERRFALAQEFSKKFPDCVLVLKGAYTLIAQNGNVRVCGEGASALAKAGSGDVLAGLVCALLAQGYNALDAATTGALAHAIASQNFCDARHEITASETAASYALTPMKLIDAVARLR